MREIQPKRPERAACDIGENQEIVVLTYRGNKILRRIEWSTHSNAVDR